MHCKVLKSATMQCNVTVMYVLDQILQLLKGFCKGRRPLSFTCLNQRRAAKIIFQGGEKMRQNFDLQHSPPLSGEFVAPQRFGLWKAFRRETNKSFLLMDKGYSRPALKLIIWIGLRCQRRAKLLLIPLMSIFTILGSWLSPFPEWSLSSALVMPSPPSPSSNLMDECW